MKPQDLGKYGGKIGDYGKSLGLSPEDFTDVCLWMAACFRAIQMHEQPDATPDIIEETHKRLDEHLEYAATGFNRMLKGK